MNLLNLTALAYIGVSNMSSAAKHIIIISLLIVLLLLCIIYPFLPGEYDALALPVSLMAQTIGLAGLPLSLIGVLWFLMPRSRYMMACIALSFGSLIWLFMSVIALLAIGKLFGLILLGIGGCLVFQWVSKLKILKRGSSGKPTVAAWYLIMLPACSCIFQMLALKPLTGWSRNRAMYNAGQLIAEIERYHNSYGEYPAGLQAQHKDFVSGIVGVEKYHYLAAGKAYNLSFEQPRFFLDRIGVREWVVYNPRDEHKAFSHTAWLFRVSPGQLEATQGWYESGQTNQPHWRYFFFD